MRDRPLNTSFEDSRSVSAAPLLAEPCMRLYKDHPVDVQWCDVVRVFAKFGKTEFGKTDRHRFSTMKSDIDRTRSSFHRKSKLPARRNAPGTLQPINKILFGAASSRGVTGQPNARLRASL
jgi:hypothetical protein